MASTIENIQKLAKSAGFVVKEKVEGILTFKHQKSGKKFIHPYEALGLCKSRVQKSIESAMQDKTMNWTDPELEELQSLHNVFHCKSCSCIQ